MKKHVAWRPHIDRDPLLNPFVPSEHTHKLEDTELDEVHADELDVGEEEEQSSAEPAAGESPKQPKPGG